MNIFDNELEDAIRFVAKKFDAGQDLKKPTLLHSIRVGVFLYQGGYSKEVCIGGILHDVIEDTETSEQEIESRFGSKIAKIVAANSKDISIVERAKRSEMLIKKCATHSRESAVIKAADILDNIRYYRKIENEINLETMIKRGRMLLVERNADFQDEVFNDLEKEIF